MVQNRAKICKRLRQGGTDRIREGWDGGLDMYVNKKEEKKGRCGGGLKMN